MAEQIKYTLEEANQYFAVAFNNKIWKLFEKKESTEDEQEEIINLAHASLLHWSNSPGCKKANLQRGEYMISMAYIHAGRKEQALYYAKRCIKITEDRAEENEDFDLAYAYLVIAMALNLNNLKEEAARYLEDAKKLGENIAGEKDKRIFISDLKDAIEGVLASLPPSDKAVIDEAQ
ncbi:hypothetical protein [Mucilaginibacter ginsenosidivorans]|uniref:Tetratricopeptide repeat protein n=1 Tax=Mucilaginibacter ginsenosidivorans TaxID=398053 RepID=A0A5B8UQS2_9SPHI|nr:hypothetical protein [Mucilaginibacter ginsenosidivorans]QEC61473.1 hypothetical protein FRZ54_02355 [Mucilaginibacter ginsenosidivorans]